MGKITLSNGHFNFFLGDLAQNLEKESLLDSLIVAGYPGSIVSNLLSKYYGENESAKRFLNRRKAISSELIYSPWITEFVIQLAQRTRNQEKLSKFTEFLDVLSLKIYALSALRKIKKSQSEIYHFRSGYGLWSAIEAKKRGMITICDHSIAHPATVDYLVNNSGKLPKNDEKLVLSEFWKLIQRDLDLSDYVIVNSDFVKRTFINRGYDPSKIIVIYSGIDNDSMSLVRNLLLDPAPPNRPKNINFLFCGRFEKRKGSQVLLDAIAKYPDSEISLEIVGVPGEQVNFLKSNLRAFPNVKIKSFMSKKEMLRKMINADVFLFPSLCEGSARVIFLAMLCRCYIITTANSGSVVIDKIHGAIIPPGDSISLRDKMIEVANLPKKDISRIGDNNYKGIVSNYNESSYFKSIKEAYLEILLKKGRSIQGLKA